MKVFFKFLLPIFLFCQLSAIDIYTAYYDNCKREIGTIIDVRDQSFDLLNVKGEIKRIQRYKVIYLATYPLDILPVDRFKNKTKTDIYSISTRMGNDVRPFLKGWAINFTKDQVSFLTTKGKEVLIDKTDMWNIKKEALQAKSGKLTQSKKLAVHFADPYPFSHCKRGASQHRVIIPQKLFSDSVDIKREFDRLQSGHHEMDRYMSRQPFYPRPEVYSNSSKLGLWLMTGAKNGASASRPNNFSPFIVNEVSMGPYSYQHLIRTGSGPLLDGTHDETQTQLYYRMKADYFHLTLMADPNLLLVGSQYKWKKHEVDGLDFRANETTLIESGLDFGKFSLGFGTYELNFGTKAVSEFHGENFGLVVFNFMYTGLNHKFKVISGQGDFSETRYTSEFPFTDQRTDFDYQFNRINYETKINKKDNLIISFINKKAEGSVFGESFSFKTNSLSGIYEYKYKKRYFFGGLLGYETGSFESLGESREINNLKLGINASLKF